MATLLISVKQGYTIEALGRLEKIINEKLDKDKVILIPGDAKLVGVADTEDLMYENFGIY